MTDYLLLIDGSALLCTQYYGSEELTSESGEPTNGIYGFMKVLAKILKDHRPSHLAVCWDVSRNTFRKEEFTEYKANRSETPDSLKRQFILCQQLLKECGIRQFYSSEYEADDYCGTISKMFENEIPVRIITKDKDYFQCISNNTYVLKICQTKKAWQNLCTKYGINTKDYPDKLFPLTPEILEKEYGYAANKVTFLKGLMGDNSDNLPGIPGIGEKSALTLVTNYSSITNLYEYIESLNETELEEWRKKLKLRKQVIDALLKETTEYNKSSKELGLLCEQLSTIKTDIPLDIKLDDLKVDIKEKEAKEALENLSIKTIILK